MSDVRVEMPAQYLDELSDAEAMAKMRTFLEEQHALNGMSVGRFIVPEKHRAMLNTHKFIRIGSKSDVRRAHIVESMRYLLKQQGWSDAPVGTYNTMFQLEAGLGIYMCIPLPAWHLREEHERAIKQAKRSREHSRAGSAIQELQRGSAVQVEALNVEQSTMSFDEFARTTKGAKRR